MDVVSNEVVSYWGSLVATLNQRGLLKDRPQRGGKIVPEADAFLLPDRVVFILDMQRLGGIARERWLDADLWAQWRAALRGRRCFVSDGGGLAICVAREPGEHIRRLRATVPLDLEDLPEAPYTVTLGISRRGRVALDLAGKNRAVLIGGTSGSGKTNLMQSVILQLAAKHTPEEVQFAIVDTKEVDFGPAFAMLPHLFAPIAHDLEDAAQLIEAVEVERLRRQAVMAQAGVNDWRRAEGLGLLVLVVDEAADFAKAPAMSTLVEVARKGRAMGISLVLATQSPSAKVISPQVRANLPTAIAFQTRTDIESRVILGKKGAEDLNRPGLALMFTDRWERVQTLHVELADVAHVAPPPRPALEEVEQRLVRYALEQLDGCFTIGTLYDSFKGEVSKRALTSLAQRWESRGWLTTPAHATDPRRVTDDLLALCPAQAGGNDDRVTGMTGGDRDTQAVIGR